MREPVPASVVHDCSVCCVWHKALAKQLLALSKAGSSHPSTPLISELRVRYRGFPTRMVYLKHDIEGFRPEWCISSMIYSRDTPFWSGTLDYIVEIHHSGRKPSIWSSHC